LAKFRVWDKIPKACTLNFWRYPNSLTTQPGTWVVSVPKPAWSVQPFRRKSSYCDEETRPYRVSR